MTRLGQFIAGKPIGDAVSLLTVFPLSKRELDRERAGQAMTWAPLVGFGLAIIAAMGIVGMRFGLDPKSPTIAETLGRALDSKVLDNVNPLAAITGIAIIALLTRGLHLDGLADTVDGLAAYTGKEQTLEIMRKPDLGPLGMASVVLVLMAQVSALTHCINLHRGTVSLVVAMVTGRVVMTLACTPATPAARSDGLGALVAGTVSRRNAIVSTGLSAAVCIFAGAADLHSLGRISETVHAGFAFLIGCLAAHLVRAHCVRRLGGITGDVLGCLGEVATTVALIVMAFGG